MDRFLDCFSSYATSLTIDDLPHEVVHEAKRRIIDLLGCAMGAYMAEPCKIARGHALEVTSNPGATILGTLHRSSPELATFSNGVMGRYLDYNDNAGGRDLKQGSHPSENIPAVLAVAEYVGADPNTTITAAVLAYEVQGSLGEAASLRARSLDHVFYVSLASAVAACKVLGLSKEKTAHALALAAIPNIALRETRRGQLTMWKAGAGPNAARNGVFAAMLARRGFTGPAQAFEGNYGVLNLVTGPMDPPSFAGSGCPYKIMEAKLKYFPAESSTQSAIHAALELRKELMSVDDVQSIIVDTFDLAIEQTADTPDKWHPTTRETADHSLPYVVVAALIDGTISLDHFKEERIFDAKVHALMQKVEVRHNPNYTKEHPEADHTRVELVTNSGMRYVKEVRYAKGHPKNPMTDDEVNDKFQSLTEPFLSEKRISDILNCLWNLERVKNLRQVLNMFVIK
ncbi:MAG: MmgE/PrpD family protein [Chloroflexi bacterium]|nr:MmgE/PrpD family protein [Chloroflexota bacterium]